MLPRQLFETIDEDNNGFVDTSEMVSTLTEVLGPALHKKRPDMPDKWYKDKIEDFAEKVTEAFVQDETKDVMNGISHAEFVKACVFSNSELERIFF